MYITLPCLLRSADIKTECLTIPAAPASDANICSQQVIPTNPRYVPPPRGQITCTNRPGNLRRNALNGPSLLKFDSSPFKNISFARDSVRSFEREHSTSLTTRILGLRSTTRQFLRRVERHSSRCRQQCGFDRQHRHYLTSNPIQAKADLVGTETVSILARNAHP